LYGISGPNIYEITDTTETLLYDVSAATNGANPTGMVGVKGSDVILLTGQSGTDVSIGYTNVFTEVNTYVDAGAGLYGGYDMVINGNDLFISGRGAGGATDYRIGKVTLASGIPQAATFTILATNLPTKNFRGIVKLSPSAGTARYIAGGNERGLTDPSNLFFTTNVETIPWAYQSTGPMTGSVNGMSSLNG